MSLNPGEVAAALGRRRGFSGPTPQTCPLPYAYLKEEGQMRTVQKAVLQSRLGFATMDIAANLDLATARAFTDLRYYMNSDLELSELKFCPLYSE